MTMLWCWGMLSLQPSLWQAFIFVYIYIQILKGLSWGRKIFTPSKCIKNRPSVGECDPLHWSYKLLGSRAVWTPQAITQQESQIVVSSFHHSDKHWYIWSWQPSVYLPILTTENVWQGSTSENQQNSHWDPRKKNERKKKKRKRFVVQFINP